MTDFRWDPPEPGADRLDCKLTITVGAVDIQISLPLLWPEVARMHHDLKQAREKKRNPRAWYEKAPG